MLYSSIHSLIFLFFHSPYEAARTANILLAIYAYLWCRIQLRNSSFCDFHSLYFSFYYYIFHSSLEHSYVKVCNFLQRNLFIIIVYFYLKMNKKWQIMDKLLWKNTVNVINYFLKQFLIYFPDDIQGGLPHFLTIHFPIATALLCCATVSKGMFF